MRLRTMSELPALCLDPFNSSSRREILALKTRPAKMARLEIGAKELMANGYQSY